MLTSSPALSRLTVPEPGSNRSGSFYGGLLVDFGALAIKVKGPARDVLRSTGEIDALIR